MKTLVLGSTGMLGHQVVNQLHARGIETIGTSRRNEKTEGSSELHFDAGQDSIQELLDSIDGLDFIVNAIGIIKPYIKDDVSSEVVRAAKINSIFPHELALAAEKNGIKVIQIATDCVYSGSEGNYDETSKHDATDVYGKSKSMGEVSSPNVMHLRCSIIGREVGRSTSLVEWVLGQEPNATIGGYLNHRWNGVTTNAFGKLTAGIIEGNNFIPGVHHVIPSNVVTKYILVSEIAKSGDRNDISISETLAKDIVDRTITTTNPDLNRQLWISAGYPDVPSVEKMVSEMFS